MIVLAGLLLGGLIVAQELGIKGASGAMSLATKAKDGALGAIGSYGKIERQILEEEFLLVV